VLKIQLKCQKWRCENYSSSDLNQKPVNGEISVLPDKSCDIYKQTDHGDG
jgi:hypothetical protein